MKLLRKLIAILSLTFVADCPVCHKHFYGFHNHMQQVRVNGRHYRIICHRCVKSLP